MIDRYIDGQRVHRCLKYILI